MFHDWYYDFFQRKNNVLCLGRNFASKIYLAARCKRVDLAVGILQIVVSG